MNKNKSFFKDEEYHAFTALEKAHFLSFAPYAFQASVLLRDYGILKLLQDHPEGLSQMDIHSKVKLSDYGVRVLIEAGLGIGLIIEKDQKYWITKTGSMFITDAMVLVNTSFMRDICYEGAGKMKESLESGKPMGLPFLGNWNTIYEGLSQLNPQQSQSWFEFDHFYSDSVFPIVMPYVFSMPSATILDIGANTGKFSIQCLSYNPRVEMTLLDLPGQLTMAEKNINDSGFHSRYSLLPHNILQSEVPIEGQYDIIWMSQFLDCFSDDEIVAILKKCKSALKPGGHILVNETFWDKQPFHAAMYALQMTSLYFTTMANGNSQMYDSRVFNQLIKRSGLQLQKEEHQIATTHSLLTIN